LSVISKHHAAETGELDLPENAQGFWRDLIQPATIIICALMLGAFLYVARPLLLPVLSAIVVGMTLGPYAGYLGKRGVPAWLVAIFVVLLLVAAANLAVMVLANPAAEMLRQVPDVAQAFKDKLQVFDRPMLAFYQLQLALGSEKLDGGVELNMTRLIEGIVTIVTPAAVQFVLQFILFIGTLFFFILGRSSFRSQAVTLFSTRDSRLRTLKILNEIESHLSGYLVVVTAINACLGLVTVVATHLMGLPYPLLWGALAFGLNYIPYIGAGINVVLLFVVGLLTFPTLLGALVPPAVFLAITTIEGQFITPMIVGRSVVSTNPLVIFLAVAFWAWLWGPLGAFLATPLLIVWRVALDHLHPARNAEIPG
jgi:predicted PurR-regulated permease PerM